MKKSVLSLAIMLTLTGCSLAPNYQRPEAPVSENWGEANASSQTSEKALPYIDEFFLDPGLQAVIQAALTNNKDLRIAALNIEAFEAQYRIQRSQLFPTIGATGGGSRQRIPANMNPTGGGRSINSQFDAQVGITSWELDLFGRITSLKDQALEQYFATEQAQRAAQLSLVAAVANAWFTLQANQNLLTVAEGTVETYQQSLNLVQRSYDAGVASSLDLRQAQTALDSARVSVATYQRLVKQSNNALQLLVGSPTDIAITPLLKMNDNALAEIPVGLPADLLQRRPDIMQAEHMLKAANANIGAARAAFFPSISLTATAGSLSSDLSGLFKSGSDTWAFTPRISVPIFTAGQLKGNLEYSKIQKDINIVQYERSIQNAFREVQDGLIARDTFQTQLEAQATLLKSTQEYYNLADRRYNEGIDNRLTLLDAQRQLFSAQQAYITTRLGQLTAQVDLYKALGGGFMEDTATP
ncbi:efflux transporter outer membrane subunit [Pseudomonas sp. F1_0610]|uniref:efflux transporter outer membrane subunit n=1 Tax=Pseudomonas sp. F1_0610 TaxID=3114284 RepID=UPI0039C478BE